MNQERYEKLAEFEPDYWIPECPVELIKGALLMDNINKVAVLQLKLCNISKKVLLSTHISIICFDETGEKLSNNSIVDFSYQDININPREFFGYKTPIPLKNNNCRKVKVKFKKLMFVDGEVLAFQNLCFVKKPFINLLSELGEDLVNEAKRILSDNPCDLKFIPNHFESNTWACTCGQINNILNHKCVRCYRDDREQFEKLNKTYLEKSLKKYVTKTKQEQLEQKKIVQELKKRKRKIISIVSVSLITLFIVVGTVYYLNLEKDYGSALKSLNNKRYQESEKMFKKIVDFKDSKNMILECKYQSAKNILSNNQYKKAEKKFMDLKNYKDSKNMVLECQYQSAKNILSNNQYKTAAKKFMDLKNYKDSKNMALECEFQEIKLQAENINDLYNDDIIEILKNAKKLSYHKDMAKYTSILNNRLEECQLLLGKWCTLRSGEMYHEYTFYEDGTAILGTGGSSYKKNIDNYTKYSFSMINNKIKLVDKKTSTTLIQYKIESLSGDSLV